MVPFKNLHPKGWTVGLFRGSVDDSVQARIQKKKKKKKKVFVAGKIFFLGGGGGGRGRGNDLPLT